MSYTKSYTIWCDGYACSEWVEYQVANAEYAVKRAREDGWSSPEWGEHYCPSCRETGDSEPSDTDR